MENNVKNLKTELADEQLDQVVGGVLDPIHIEGHYEYVYRCQACGKEKSFSIKAADFKCGSCGYILEYVKAVWVARSGKE